MTVQIEFYDGDMSKVLPVLRILRSDMSEATFEDRVRQAVASGYRMLGASTHDTIQGCLGFRITFDVFWGKTFFIDDLVVRPEARGQCIGAALLAQATALAEDWACDHIRLCSGLDRADAHRFYQCHDFRRSSIQFSRALKQGSL